MGTGDQDQQIDISHLASIVRPPKLGNRERSRPPDRYRLSDCACLTVAQAGLDYRRSADETTCRPSGTAIMSDESMPQPPDPLAGRPEFLDDPPPGGDELPPVEPPSAGFIVQLFVVPAIIVAMIVGVYLLFGRLASGEQDWRKQLTDIRSENPHVRWRGALGLSQMLNADATADGQRLAENRDVANEIASLLEQSIGKASVGEDDLKQQEFLVRDVGDDRRR